METGGLVPLCVSETVPCCLPFRFNQELKSELCLPHIHLTVAATGGTQWWSTRVTYLNVAIYNKTIKNEKPKINNRLYGTPGQQGCRGKLGTYSHSVYTYTLQLFWRWGWSSCSSQFYRCTICWYLPFHPCLRFRP